MSAFLFFGKITIGFLSDHIGRFNMAVVCGIMACIAHLAGIYSRNLFNLHDIYNKTNNLKFMLTLFIIVWLTATSEGSMWAFAILYGKFIFYQDQSLSCSAYRIHTGN